MVKGLWIQTPVEEWVHLAANHGAQMKLKDYLGHPGVSSSDLRAFLKCPLKFANRGKKMVSPAMTIGSAVHAMVEGIFNEAFAVIPEGIDRRTKSGKEAFAEFQKASDGKEILTREQNEAVMGMADSVLNLLDRRFSFAEREHEPSLFWMEEGLQCKARPDILIGGIEPCVIEIKTTQDARRDEWFWNVKKFDYGIQAVHHLAGIENQRRLILPYAWLVVENEQPYASVIHWLVPGPRLQHDEWRRIQALRSLMRCIDERCFPSFSEDDIQW